jgi:hypothetical protein
LLAALLGATVLAERIIHKLADDKRSLDPDNSIISPFDAGIIALQLPTTVTATRLLRQFETTEKHVAALYIAAELGDIEAVNRLLEHIIARGIRAAHRQHLLYIVGSLMLAVPYNPALGRKVLKVVEDIRGVRYVKDDIEYLANAGRIAAILGENTYAKRAIACCLDKKWYLEAEQITALLGEAILTAILLSKAYHESKDSYPPSYDLSSTMVGNILGALAKRHPSAAVRIWKAIEPLDPNRYKDIAGRILAHFTCLSPLFL